MIREIKLWIALTNNVYDNPTVDFIVHTYSHNNRLRLTTYSSTLLWFAHTSRNAARPDVGLLPGITVLTPPPGLLDRERARE